MKNTTVVLLISLIICTFCLVSICVAPVINNLLNNFSQWGKLNCDYYSDRSEYSSTLNDHFQNQKLKNLCRRQNAMYGLEYSAFIINLFLAALLSQLTLIHYFDKGYAFEKTTGLIGFIGGLVAFVLMLVYVCFSGYIFTQDVAYKQVYFIDPNQNAVTKLYPNGASQKRIEDNYVTIYEKDKSDEAQYIKYKDLGDSQYNYNKKYYESYYYTIENGNSQCLSTPTTCDYVYAAPFSDNMNKYLYNRWCLCLVLAVFVVVLNAIVAIFGFRVFKGGDNSENKIISIV